MNLHNVKYGIAGGLAGGAVFGMMMGMMGMLPMIAGMAGLSTAAAGFAIHMGISAFIGAGFAVLFGKRSSNKAAGFGNGLLYGAVWWVLGPLTLMPLMMGMGVNWSMSAAVAAMPSLLGHLIYGCILGWTYALLDRPKHSDSPVSAH